MDLFFTLLIEFGLPVAASAVMGLFIYIILKYILGSVIGQVQGMHGIIMGLDNRIKTMNNEVVRIDVSVCHAFGISPDLNRLSRADGQKDGRKD